MPKGPKLESRTLVVGHQRPDTDSAVSAVVYAALLNASSQNGERFEGVVLGEPSVQTKWLFGAAGVPLPRLVSDLHPRVRDAARCDVFSVGPQASLGDVLRLILQHHISVVPVLDENRRLAGLLSDRMPMANYFYHANAEDFLGVMLGIDDVIRHLRLKQWQAPTREADGQIVLDPTRITPGSVVLGGDQPELLRAAWEAGAAAVIVCIRDKTALWARTIRSVRGLGVYQFCGSLMALAAEIPMSIPASRLMLREGFSKLSPEQPLPEAHEALRQAQFALPVINPDGTLFGVLSRSEVLNFPRPRVVLVDHFEQHQAPEGISHAEILEIVDHHRVGTLETSMPIRVDCRPVGSTATIISCKFREQGKQPTRSQAMLLLGAIIADTLLLRSPTTTELDRQQTRALAKRARVGLETFGREVLVQNDETLQRSEAELVEKDLKEFSAAGFQFAVAQIETVDRTRLQGQKLRQLAAALRQRRQSSPWDFLALMVTDIFRGDSLVLADLRSVVLERKIFPGGTSGEVWPGCVSRKKQFLPEILRRLSADKP